MSCGNPCNKFIFLFCDKSESNFPWNRLPLRICFLLIRHGLLEWTRVVLFSFFDLVDYLLLLFVLRYGYEFLFLVSDRWISDWPGSSEWRKFSRLLFLDDFWQLNTVVVEPWFLKWPIYVAFILSCYLRNCALFLYIKIPIHHRVEFEIRRDPCYFDFISSFPGYQIYKQTVMDWIYSWKDSIFYGFCSCSGSGGVDTEPVAKHS